MRADKERDGFLKLPNQTIDALLRTDLTACELKICLVILTWTLGFRRNECQAGLTALSNRIPTHNRRGIGKAVADLVRRGLRI